MPPVGRFAWDFIIEGNLADQSGYDFATQHAAEVAAVRRLYAYFDSLNALAEKDVAYTLYVVSQARTRHDDPVVQECVTGFTLPWLIRDNGGESCDRYTIYFEGDEYLSLGASGDSYGWGEARRRIGGPDYDDDAAWSHVGKRLTWAELPEQIRAAIRARMDEALEYFERDNA